MLSENGSHFLLASMFLLNALLMEMETARPWITLILGLHPANERHRYKVTLSLIGWVQT